MTGDNATARTISRRLEDRDREQAIEVLELGIPEVPIYRWLLGEPLDPAAVRWYAELILVDLFEGLHGTFDEDDNLLTIIAINDKNVTKGVPSEEFNDRSRHFVKNIDGFIDRFMELKKVTAETKPEGDTLDLVFGMVHPDRRGAGTFAALIDHLISDAINNGTTVVASTGNKGLSDHYARTRNAPVVAEYTLTGGPTIWVHRFDPPAE